MGNHVPVRTYCIELLPIVFYHYHLLKANAEGDAFVSAILRKHISSYSSMRYIIEYTYSLEAVSH